MDNLFLYRNGFKYNGCYDSWDKEVIDGTLIIYKKLRESKWVLEYEDVEHYVHRLMESSNTEDFERKFIEIERDRKIKYLLGE